MTSDMFNFQDFDPEEAAALLFTNAIESDELESPYVKAELDGDEPFPSDHNMYKIEDPNQMEDPNKVEDPNQNEMVVSSNRINLDETFSNDSFSSNGSCASLITCFKIETRHRGRPTKSPEEKFDYFNMHGIKGINKDHWDVLLYGDNTLHFVCKLCCKTFKILHSLKQHYKFVHLKIRPFPCSHCEKRFRSMYDLRRHLTIHTQERFACHLCGITYCSKQRVLAHMRRNCYYTSPFCATRQNCNLSSSLFASASFRRDCKALGDLCVSEVGASFAKHSHALQ